MPFSLEAKLVGRGGGLRRTPSPFTIVITVHLGKGAAEGLSPHPGASRFGGSPHDFDQLSLAHP
jgi:hypothetical protein